MQVSSKIKASDGIEITIGVTATVREWRALLKQLGSGHPAWILDAEIRDAIRRVENEIFSPSVEVADGDR